MEFSFVVKWVPGKTHHIADALSRAPLFSPEETDNMRIDKARACLATTPGMANKLDTILNAVDADYIKLKHDILNSTQTSVYARQLRSVFSHLSIDDDLVYIDAKRIVLPIAAVKNIRALAHTTHSGISKTYKLCRSMYFWPGMFNDIKQMISACSPCSLNASSLTKNLRSTLPPLSHLGPPMAHVGFDLFDFSGKSHLICVNRCSGYPMFAALNYTSPTSITKTLQSLFNILGWPRSIRSDGGPQFCGEFLSFCEKFGIKHKLASPYNKIIETGNKITLGTLTKEDGSITDPGEDTVKNLLSKHFPDGQPIKPTVYSSKTVRKDDICAWKPDWITAEKLGEVFKIFKSKKSPGTDGLSPMVLKNLPPAFLKHIVHLYKCLIKLNFKPTRWKESKMVFIPKPGKETYKVYKSWRGIFLTNYFLKALEKLCCWHTDEKIAQYPIHPRQHGFRNDRSTETALSNVVNYIEKYINYGEHVLAVFLDIQAAFDTISTNKIYEERIKHGVDNNLAKWYYNYISHRNMYTTINGITQAITQSCANLRSEKTCLVYSSWLL